MEHCFEINDIAMCGRCGSTRVKVYAWCCVPDCELVCPACGLSEVVDGGWAMSMVDAEFERKYAQTPKLLSNTLGDRVY